jgi:hypothetical protein
MAKKLRIWPIRCTTAKILLEVTSCCPVCAVHDLCAWANPARANLAIILSWPN